ncbi:adenylosuccinate lyase [Tenacibaculum xiamenense]|uniref:adenylosuccinate lyase n=1 Tax=Tenacibaculum xiamenense TaxID=1261553 RepID=UPI0038957D9B
MNSDSLISILNDVVNASKVNRTKAANIILNDESLFKELVKFVFNVDDKLSIKAAWILEWICTHHGIDYILPYLDILTENIGKLKFDSAIRPCSKICERLAMAYDSKNDNNTKVVLTESHIDLIIETGFDWLISDQKIAVRAYTMNTLFFFGKEKDWVHPELKHLITSKIVYESKGTEARGKHVLYLIEKFNNSK